jgi:hypothetical protein
MLFKGRFTLKDGPSGCFLCRSDYHLQTFSTLRRKTTVAFAVIWKSKSSRALILWHFTSTLGKNDQWQLSRVASIMQSGTLAKLGLSFVLRQERHLQIIFTHRFLTGW